jgi:beta-RFAP synthase
MVDAPGLSLSATAAQEWSAEGPLAGRALAFARTFCDNLSKERGLLLRPHRLVIASAGPEHVGLGTGTQLGLAVARVLAVGAGLDLDVAALARLVGRGLRSWVGTWGFAMGGFLVEAGQRTEGGPSPLIARVPLPDSWRVLLVTPESPGSWHGWRERQAFLAQENPESARERLAQLSRLACLEMVPALMEEDLPGFAEAAYQFNALAGRPFAAAQGGDYASPAIARIIAWFRDQGIAGVGQSSWGPTVFAFFPDEQAAWQIAARLGTPALVCRPCNHGAQL